jgi:hypothetical protein
MRAVGREMRQTWGIEAQALAADGISDGTEIELNSGIYLI